METVRLTQENSAKLAAKTAAALAAGGVILYPTDTLYGLGADGLSDEALLKLRKVKGRNERKPIHAIVADLDMAEKYAEVSENARLLVGAFGGKVTVILKKKPEVNTGIGKWMETFGFRIPDHDFCIEMCRAFGKPIIATSANKADIRPQMTFERIVEQFGESTKDIDLAIDAGDLPARAPSTVVDLAHEEIAILREAAVPAADIWEVLRTEP